MSLDRYAAFGALHPPGMTAVRRALGWPLVLGVGLLAGCQGDPTGPRLPRDLTLRVGTAHVLAPKVTSRHWIHTWECSDTTVATVHPSPGDCTGTIIPRCEEGPGITATVHARNPGQATVRVCSPPDAKEACAAVLVTVIPAAP